MSRRKVESQDVPTVPPVNFLLTCSDRMLGDYELKVLADVANARDVMIEALDKFAEHLAQAGIIRWFRSKDRDEIKRDLESDDVIAIAKEQIRAGQRSEQELAEELIPRPSLPPGKAHLAAALRYQKRNLAEGKCMACPEPLARNSVVYCEKHLTAARLRIKPKNAKGSPPGSIGWLHGDGFQSQQGRQPGTLQSLALNRQKKSRAILADMGLPLGSTATALQAAKEALLEHIPKDDTITAMDLFGKAGLSEMESTAKHALLELVSAGLVQRIRKGVRSEPFLYFIAMRSGRGVRARGKRNKTMPC